MKQSIALRTSLVLAALAAATLSVEAQYRSAYGYNPYTGRSAQGQAAHNPYTGTNADTTREYNPYTGRESTQRSAYNPYTGRSAQVDTTHNPYTGRTSCAYRYGRR